MSSSYNIFPLGPTFSDDPSWLRDSGFRLPQGWEESRTPTIEDFRNILGTWDSFEYEEAIEGNSLTIWATRRDRWDSTTIFIDIDKANHGELNTIKWLRFNNGEPSWLVSVTERLSQHCGPFLLTDNGGAVTIVSPGTSPEVGWVELT